ncbi:MAG TPA: hypothetical protein VF944_05125, partial [Candidatus Bathyarchaeia archaeon]
MVQIGSERKTVQNPLIRYAIEAGWSYLVPGECLRLRCGETSSILWEVFEAHRTTGGDLGDFLMGALPNATYLGFTGTPIDKTAYGKGTFKVFGIDDPQGYLDKYSIAESIEDGTTVPLYYTLAPNELRVDRETLEQEFL